MLLHKNIQVIGIHGLAGHGKTTAAAYLAEQTGFTVIALADPLKLGCSGMYNLDIAYFYDQQGSPENLCRNTTVIEPYGLTIRQMMRTLGDAMKDKAGGGFWINLTRNLMEVAVSRDPAIRGFIVEDVRYGENNPWGPEGDEQAAIHKWGGTLFHIKRDLALEVHKDHCSEMGLPVLENEIVIDNNDDLSHLHHQLSQSVNSLGLIKL